MEVARAEKRPIAENGKENVGTGPEEAAVHVASVTPAETCSHAAFRRRYAEGTDMRAERNGEPAVQINLVAVHVSEGDVCLIDQSVSDAEIVLVNDISPFGNTHIMHGHFDNISGFHAFDIHRSRIGIRLRLLCPPRRRAGENLVLSLKSAFPRVVGLEKKMLALFDGKFRRFILIKSIYALIFQELLHEIRLPFNFCAFILSPDKRAVNNSLPFT